MFQYKNILLIAIAASLVFASCGNSAKPGTTASGGSSGSSGGSSGGSTSATVAAPSMPVLSAASDTGISNVDAITNITTGLVFTGTAADGNSVELFVDGAASGMKGTATGGSWSITHTGTISAGNHNVTGVATDSSANSSAASTALPLVIDNSVNTPSAPDLAAADDLGISSADNFTAKTTGLHFSGTAEADSSVQIYQDGVATGAPVTATGGAYSASIDLNPVADATYTIIAIATDIAGNISSSSTGLSLVINTVPPASFVAGTNGAIVPALNSVSDSGTSQTDGITNISSGLVFTGSLGNANAGAIVDVYVNGVLAGTAIADASGNYSIGPTGAVSSGPVTFFITTPSGAVSSLIAAGNITIDTIAPSGYSIAIDQTGINNTNKTAMSFTFSNAEINAIYDYTISSSGGGANVYGSGTIAAISEIVGNINVTGLNDGTLTLSVTLTDATGNVGTPSTSARIKDTTNPTVSIISAAVINNANKTSYSVNGACSENGQVVTVNVGGVIATPTCNALSYTTAAMNISSVADNAALSITATHLDAAGNSAVASIGVIKDTINPTVTISSPVIISIANAANYTISGACSENGQTVTVNVGGVIASPVCSGLAYTTTAMNVNGVVDNAAVSITANHSDAVGNAAVPASTTVLKETTNPVILSITSSTPSGTYGTGNVINITLNFSEPVTLSGGNLVVTLNNAQTITISPFSNSTTASGSYLVASGLAEAMSSLDVSGIALSAGIIADPANPASLSLPMAPNRLQDNKNIVIGDIPDIVSINSSTLDGSYKAAQNINVTITFSTNVTLTGGTLDITLDTGGVVSISPFTSQSVVSGTYTVGAAHNSPDLNAVSAALSAGTLQDSVSLLSVGLGMPISNLSANRNIIIDTIAPSGYNVAIDQSAIYNANKTALSFTLGNAEVNSLYNYTISSSGGGTNVTGSGAIASISQQINTIDVSALNDGTLTLSVTLTDSAGNTGTAATNTKLKDTANPTVTITSAAIINNANKTNYSVSGACSENGRIVTVNVGGVLATPTCTSLVYATTAMNVSAVADNAALGVTAMHNDAVGNTSQASTTVIKDTANPTVTITSAAIINNTNKTNYSVSGACSENGQIVTVNVGGVTATPACAALGYTATGMNVSGIADGAATSITANHSDAAGNTATQASVSVVKDTINPSIASITSTTPNGTYGNGNSINITLTFDEAVSLSGGNLVVTLNNAKTVTIGSFASSTIASGTYTVVSGFLETINPLDASSVSLSGGSITDLEGNPASLTLPMAPNRLQDTSIIKVGNIPSILSINSSTPDAPYTVGQAINVAVNFSSNVTLTGGTLDLTLDTGSIVSILPFTNLSTVSGTYTVGVAQNSSDLNVTTAALSAGTLLDAITSSTTSLALPSGNNLADNKAIVIDTVSPVISGTIPNSGAFRNNTNLSYTLSENIASGTITWTGTSGPDNGVVHAQSLSGAELNAGAHSNITLISAPTLISGSVYTISFNATDAAGNAATTITKTNIAYDTVAPVFSLVAPANSASVNNVKVNYTLSEVLASGTITWTGTAGPDNGVVHAQTLTGGDLNSGNHTNWLISTPPTLADGSTYNIAFNGLDAAGNAAATVTITGVLYDITAPANQNVVFASSTSKTGGALVVVTSSGVTGNSIWFAPSGLSNVTQFTADSTHTTAGGTAINILTPATAGSYKMYIIDAAGNVSAESTAVLTVDNTAPTVTVNQAAGQSDPVSVLPVNFTVIFSEPINTASFTTASITETGSTASGISWIITNNNPGTDTNFTLSASSVSVQGAIVPGITAGAVQDIAGNNNTPSTSTDNSVTYTQPLTVTINQAAGQADPINTLPVTFTIIFSSAITPGTFTSADITQTGTATGLIWSVPATSDNIIWSVQATGSGQGTIVPTIAANAVQDSILRSNNASTSTDNSVTYELVKPGVAINQSAAQIDPVNVNPVNFTLVFTEAIKASTFAVSDFTPGGTATYTLGNLSTSDNITWTVDATVTADGTVIPSLAGGVLTDPAGNTNNASTSTDNTVTFDSVAPTAIISGAPSGTNNVNALDITISGSGVANYQYALGNGIACSGAAYSGNTSVVTHITDNISGLVDGTIVLCVRGKDGAGNLQTAASATSVSWTKDSTAVAATITGAPTGTNNLATLATNPVTIGGTGVIEYKYAIISNAASNCAGATYTGGGAANGGILVSTSIVSSFSGLADGGVTLCVIGFKSPSWQAVTSASLATWTKQATAPTIVSAESLDMDGNGKIDHMKVTLSGNVNDTTFPGYAANSLGTATTDWVVGTYNNRKLRQGSAVSTFSGGAYTDTANDNIIYIAFDENAGLCNLVSQAGCDTGIIPDLTTSATPGLKDSIGTGNSILQISTGTIAEIDSARPVVVGANPYSNTTLNIYFSESVTAATAECGAGSSQSAKVCSTIYSINGGLTVSKAYMGGGIGVPGNSVVLTTSAQTVSQAYTATAIAGVIKDVSNQVVYSPKNTANFNGAPATTNLLSAAAINNTTVELTFNVDVTSGTANCASYVSCDNGTGVIYHIPGLQVTSAAVQATATKVRLTTSSQLSNTANGYQVTVTSGMVSAVTGGLTCNSPNNTSNFTGDTMPEVQSVATLTATQVDIIFSEYVLMDVSASGALNAANYTISPTLGTLSVTQLSNTKVRLTSTTGQTASVLYTVTVNNVTDITAPAGNVISPTAKTGTFIGQENLKILSGTKVAGVSTAFEVFSVTFSKPLIFGGGANAVDNMANWTFPSGMNTVTLCTPSDDAVCSPNNTINYVTGSDSVVYFKASPIPAGGAYTVVGASSGNCIKPSTDPGCLQANPNDRASIDFNLPLTISSGPVYTDPFNDAVTLSGQVLVYNGKLLVGPNNTDSGLFETNINMTNATSITLDSDSVAAGFQPFRGNATTNPPPLLGIFEDCAAGNCSTGNNYLAGIDYLYGACYTSGSPFVDSSLTGVACVNAGGTEYLFVLGYNTTATTTGYQSNWNTTNKVSPFIFTHVTGLSNAASRTYRAMNARVFKGWVYQASQHQAGTMAVRWNRFTPDGLTRVDLAGNFLNRIGEGGSINNGQQPAANGLISIDSMYEYDNDGSGGTNFSALYIANGGSCSVNGAADTTCLSGATRTAATFSDGGVLRTTQAYSDITPPPACTSAANCDTKFEDVTPTSGKWLSFMSIPLPDNAAPGGDWDQLQPINTIRPAIKAVPKMRTFNGDLYMIRNACASNTPYTVALGNFVSNGRKTCAAGSEVPQLWRLPKFTGTCSTSSLSGTISMTSGSAFVWGSGTSFGTELVAGDSIISNGSTQTIALIGGGTLSGAVMKRTGSTLLTGVGTNFPLEVATGSTITVGGVARTVATMGSGTLVGTVSVTAGSNTVVGGTGGAATRFQDQAIVGTSITIGGTTRTIAGITSATAMTITGTWPATLSAQTASVSGSAYLTMTATWTANSNSPGVTATVADNNLLTTTTTWPSTGAGKIFTLAVPKLNSLYTDQTACQSISGTWTAGTNGSYGGSAWKLVAEYGSTGKTIMAGASWSGGSNQTNLTLTNTEITLLVANGNRLYIGFDNASYGANIWRTKDKTLFANYSTLGVNAYPALESDFEAVCAAGNACTDPSMEFGFGSGASVNRIFDGITANDAGTDYVVVNAGDGINPLKIYRNTNN